jgi:hypothetical protein
VPCDVGAANLHAGEISWIAAHKQNFARFHFGLGKKPLGRDDFNLI